LLRWFSLAIRRPARCAVILSIHSRKSATRNVRDIKRLAVYVVQSIDSLSAAHDGQKLRPKSTHKDGTSGASCLLKAKFLRRARAPESSRGQRPVSVNLRARNPSRNWRFCNPRSLPDMICGGGSILWATPMQARGERSFGGRTSKRPKPQREGPPGRLLGLRLQLAPPGAYRIPAPGSRSRPQRPSPLAGGFWFSQSSDSGESLIAPSARSDAPPPRCRQLRRPASVWLCARACCCKSSSACMLIVRGPCPRTHGERKAQAAQRAAANTKRPPRPSPADR